MQILPNKNFNIKQIGLRLVKQCPNCKASFKLGDVEPLSAAENEGENMAVYFQCAQCASSLIVTINQMPFGLVGHAMLTDLDSSEAVRLGQSDELGEDEVIEVYKCLNHDRRSD